jgi:hypothetical protein
MHSSMPVKHSRQTDSCMLYATLLLLLLLHHLLLLVAVGVPAAST